MRQAASLIAIADSVTKELSEAEGCVVVAASHGGRFAALLAAATPLRGVILHDASRGLDDAGVAGVLAVDEFGLPAAAVDFRTARIGDGEDMFSRGVISVANASARILGVEAGMLARVAAQTLTRGRIVPAANVDLSEARFSLGSAGERAIWGLDSHSLVGPDDAGAIVVTGSHGGLLGGNPATAVKAAVYAAFYNDAGIGIDDAGISRLPALQDRGIIGATVAAASARIGEARSTWETGRISACNACARAAGAERGMPLRAFVERLQA